MSENNARIEIFLGPWVDDGPPFRAYRSARVVVSFGEQVNASFLGTLNVNESATPEKIRRALLSNALGSSFSPIDEETESIAPKVSMSMKFEEIAEDVEIVIHRADSSGNSIEEP